MGHYNKDSYISIGRVCDRAWWEIVSVDEVDFVRKQSFLVSGVSAGFMSRSTSCPLVSDYLFKDVCTANGSPSWQRAGLLAVRYIRFGAPSLTLSQLHTDTHTASAWAPPCCPLGLGVRGAVADMKLMLLLGCQQ